MVLGSTAALAVVSTPTGPALLPAAGVARGPADEIAVTGVPPEASIHFDGSPWWGNTERRENLTVLVPTSVLSPGAHSLEVVRRGPSGQVETLAELAVEVAEPALRPPDGETRGPLDRLRLSGLPAAASYSLDGDRWAGEVESQDGLVVLVPTSPLAAGEHRLEVTYAFPAVEDEPVGTIEELAVFDFAVGAEEPAAAAVAAEPSEEERLREGELAVDANLSVNWRVVEDGLMEPLPDRLQSGGSARVDGDVWGEAWRFGVDLNFAYDSQGLITGREIDLNTFLLEGETSSFGVRLGDQNVHAGTIALDDFHRRGLTARLDLRSDLRLTGFSLSARPVVGLDEGLSIDDPESRVDGGMLEKTFLGRSTRVDLTGVYLSAEGSPFAGTGIQTGTNQPTPITTDVWSVRVTSRQRAERLSLAGEYAESRADLDGAGQDPERSDEAFELSAIFRSPPPVADGATNRWQFGLGRKRVGTFFRSLANPSLLRDRDLIELWTQVEWERVDMRVALDRRENNVENLSGLPTRQTDRGSLSLTWRVPVPDDERPVPWLRPALVALLVTLSDEEAVDNPDPTFVLDSQSRVINFLVSGNSWNMSYSDSRFEDVTQADDLTLRSFSVDAAFAGASWTLAPGAQWTRRGEFLGDPAVTTVVARLDARRSLASGKVALALGAEYLRESAGATEGSRRLLNGSLDWQLLPPANGRPGLAAWIRGSHTDDDGDAVTLFLPMATTQIFVGARLSWSRRPNE